MVTIAELEQRISDNRRAGARLLTTEETLAVVALLKVLLPRADIEAQPVLEAVQDFARLP